MMKTSKSTVMTSLSRPALFCLPALWMLGGCATYEITPSDTNVDDLRGVSYFLPKTQVDATVTWRITQCRDINKPFLQPNISETVITTTDHSEHFMIDTSKLSGGVSNDTLGLKVNDQGVLTAFNVVSDGVADEIISQATELAAPLIGKFLPGGIALAAGSGSSFLCDMEINGSKVVDLLNERETIKAALDELTETQKSGYDSKVEDIGKNWVTTKAVDARRTQLSERLAAADDLLTFSSRRTFDLNPGKIIGFEIDIDLLQATNVIKDKHKFLPNLRNQSRLTAYVSDQSGWTPSKNGYPNKKKSKNSLIYRIPGKAQVEYRIDTKSPKKVVLVTTRHPSPQAGRYAHLPLSTAAFGKTDTKVTFNALGVMTSYGLEETSGVSAALTSVNAAISDVKGQSTKKANAEKEAYEAELARLTAKKALEDFKKQSD